MNDQNFYVMPNSDNNQPARPVAPQAPVSPAAPQAAPRPVAPSYEAPKAPQPSNATFEYNQLYGNKTATVEKKEALVFEEPTMETSAVVAADEPTITISNDELIPEFDASVLEVIPEQEKKNINVQQPTANVSSMSTGKQAEQDKSRSNTIFIAVLFGVILLAVFFLFPILVKM